MTDEKRQQYALMRYGIIAPAVNHTLPEGMPLQRFWEEAAEKEYIDPDGNLRRFTSKTIQRWYYFYERAGFDALCRQPRNDAGRSRKIDADIREQILFLKKQHPRMPATEIHRWLVENGFIRKDEISLSTVTRQVNLLKQEQSLPAPSDMRRYERPHINEVWCADSCVGPKILLNGSKQRIYIIAIIDDASRFITGADVFTQDNFVSLMSVMKSATAKYGIPKVWNFDNGSTYKNHQMELLAARLGSVIHYCKPYTPTQKSKIERWFRTLRDKWLGITDLSSFSGLDDIRSSLHEFVQRYNQSVHASLDGKSPEQRFFSEPEYIRRISAEENERTFLLELERRVSADSVLVIDKVEYEVDCRFAGKRIRLRCLPDMKRVYVVEADGTLTGVRVLNKHENAVTKRKKVYLSEGGEN